VQIGVVVPTFAARAEPASEVAKEAERKGLHGAFCFDHLWPLEDPGKPAIAPFPFLGLLSAETTTLRLGTLVARIGLVPDDVLISEFRTLAVLTGGRVVAALGPGDRLSAEENLAYGLEFEPAARRLASLSRVASVLMGERIEVWIGSGEERTNAVARETGATLNLFDVDAEVVRRHARMGPVSWAGPLSKRPQVAAGALRRLASAGATWAVVSSRNPIDRIVEAAKDAGIDLAA
jgi:alkanesulfonate monooxygenase SsuD/methylene tetrahydromethanopterin reductase-like flavin-dependent oxidoreductase (luciferase family)